RLHVIGKSIARIEPGKTEVITFAAKIFQTGPRHGNERHRPARSEADEAEACYKPEESNPKGQHEPKRERRRPENGVETGKLRRKSEQARGESEVKSA